MPKYTWTRITKTNLSAKNENYDVCTKTKLNAEGFLLKLAAGKTYSKRKLYHPNRITHL